MISIDLFYKTLLTIANSDIRGNVKPQDARLIINQAVNERYEEYSDIINKHLNRQNRGLATIDTHSIVREVRQKIEHYLVENVSLSYSSGYFELPENLMYAVAIDYRGNDVEFCKNTREFNLINNNPDTKPSSIYPIGLFVGDKIKIAPSTIENEVKISFLRKPVLCNWSYIVVSGAEVVNPNASDYRDIDIHRSEFSNLMLKCCKLLGINLKEQDLSAITTNFEIQNKNQENNVM